MTNHSLENFWETTQEYAQECVTFLQEEQNFYATIACSTIALFIIATLSCNFISYPIIFFGSIAALFAYQSYKFTKEKFRLDLRSERMPSFITMKELIYSLHGGVGFIPIPKSDLSIISIDPDDWVFIRNGDLIKQTREKINALTIKKENASSLMEDIYILYGEDIKMELREIQRSLSQLERIWPKSLPTQMNKDDMAKINSQLMSINDSISSLGDKLLRYISFGEYSK